MPGLIFLVMVIGVCASVCWLCTSSKVLAPIVLGMAIFFGGIGLLVYDYSHTEVRTIIVEYKDRGGGDGSYRIYTDGDTLAVKEILFVDIRRYHRYRITVRGWEFGPLSMMPNIDRILQDLGPVEGCNPDD